jgi:hypothetical protein
MIGAVLLGNNLINILASALATQVLTTLIPGPWGVAVATAAMTVLVLVFAEVLPKTVAIVRSGRHGPRPVGPDPVHRPGVRPDHLRDPVDRAPRPAGVRGQAGHGRRRAGGPRGDPRRGRLPPLRRPGRKRRPADAGRGAGPLGHGRLGDHGPPQVDGAAGRRPAARELVDEVLEAQHTRVPLLSRRARQHRRRAARPRPAEGPGRSPTASRAWISPPSCASRGSSPTPPTSRTSSTPS